MIAVIFEFWPNAERKAEYFEIAGRLKAHLETIDGFISIERFESLTSKDKVLSLSFWRDEEAVRHWRNLEEHRSAQTSGRSGIFDNYRLRVASVIRDYGKDERGEAPADSRDKHG